MRFPSGTVDQYLYFVTVDAADHVTRVDTGLNFVAKRSRNGGAWATFTTPTINSTDTGGDGIWEILLDEDMTIGAGNFSEEMVIHIEDTGGRVDPVTRVFELFRTNVTELGGDTGAVAHLAQMSDEYDTGRLAAEATATLDTGAVNQAVWTADASRTLTSLDVDTGLRALIADLDTGLRDAIDNVDTGLSGIKAGVNVSQIAGDTGAAAHLQQAANVSGTLEIRDTGLYDRISNLDTGLRAALDNVDTGLHDDFLTLDTGLRSQIIQRTTDTGLRVYMDRLDTGMRAFVDNVDTGLHGYVASDTGIHDIISHLDTGLRDEIANLDTGIKTGGVDVGRIFGDTGAADQLQKAFASGLNDTGLNDRLSKIQAEVDTGIRSHVDHSDTGVKDVLAALDTGLRDYMNDIDTGIRALMDDYDTGLRSHIDHTDTGIRGAVDNVDTGVHGVIAASDTGISAIKAKTDSLTFTKAGEVDSNIQSVNDVTVSGTGSSGDEWGP